MKTLGSTASVVAAMRDDAAAEIERIERDGEAQVAAFDAEPAAALDVPEREERIAAALRKSREKLSQEDASDARTALEARERWFARGAEMGRQLLLAARPAEERRALLAKWTREALDRMPAGDRTLHVAQGDLALLDAPFLAGLGVKLGPTAAISGGCIVRCGRVSVDNSFEERARRLEAQLRSALGKVYAQ